MLNTVKYTWREAFAPVWHASRCEVLSYTDKTAEIRLLEYGKNGTPPGTVMRVRLKSLKGFIKPAVTPPDWHGYTD